jgi:hypothetical protein
VADEEAGTISRERVEDLLRILHSAGYWFLEDDMPAFARRPYREVPVEGCWQADVDHLDILRSDEILVGGVRSRPHYLSTRNGGLDTGVGDTYHLYVRDAGVGVKMNAAHKARTYQADPHSHTPSCLVQV